MSFSNYSAKASSFALRYGACVVLWLALGASVAAVALKEDTLSAPVRQDDDGRETDGQVVLMRIGVASCNKHDAPQGYWRTMSERMFADTSNQVRLSRASTTAPATLPSVPSRKLDAFVWLGDVVYADSALMPGVWYASSHALVESKYRAQKSNPLYQEFCSASTRHVFGVWDDHDYGMNDGGKEFADKEVVRRIFLDFLDVPQDSIRRTQRGGIYTAETLSFGELVEANNASNSSRAALAALESLRKHFTFAVCLVLLDVRYSRDPISADRTGDMLGEAQWEWLDALLGDWFPAAATGQQTSETVLRHREGKCLLTLIGGGIQVTLDEKPTEHWANYPASRNRLLALLRKHHASRIAFLSGDVHLGEIGVDDTPEAIAALGYPIVELTASGLTHSSATIPLVPKLFLRMFPSHRRRGVYLGKNFGTVSLVATPLGGECRGPLTSAVGAALVDDPLDGVALELQVHSLEASTDTKDGRALRDSHYVAVRQQICLRELQPRHQNSTSTRVIDTAAPVVVSYPETPPGAVKSILMATQYYVFPSLRFHQLINLYVGAALAVIGLTTFWLLVVLSRVVRRRSLIPAKIWQWMRSLFGRKTSGVPVPPLSEDPQPVVAQKKHQ